jgi:hypothetical protein
VFQLKMTPFFQRPPLPRDRSNASIVKAELQSGYQKCLLTIGSAVSRTLQT